YSKTVELPQHIELKVNMLVELFAGNYDIQDGLVNGSDGVFKTYTTTDGLDAVWIKFNDPSIGKQQRSKHPQLTTLPAELDWTPIVRVARPLHRTSLKTPVTIRKQFPVQLCSARTIHRAQGLTLERLAFSPLGVSSHGLAYTALSRVRTISSLYLLSPLTKKNFSIKQAISTEMERLRNEAKWNIQHELSTADISLSIIIASLNTRSLHAHREAILHDHELMQSQILCLQETHIASAIAMDYLDRYQCLSAHHVHGLPIFIANNIRLVEKHCFHNAHVESLLAKILLQQQRISVVNVYVAPNANLENIFIVLDNVFRSLDLSIPTYILGDFNIDMQNKNRKTAMLVAFMQKNNFTFHIQHSSVFTKNMIDHIWSNTILETCNTFERFAYWTDHPAIFAVFENTNNSSPQ
ncbi:hypothetical protein KI387_017721, partial [Taxus chinensis]